jgi:hypothetical protein
MLPRQILVLVGDFEQAKEVIKITASQIIA